MQCLMRVMLQSFIQFAFNHKCNNYAVPLVYMLPVEWYAHRAQQQSRIFIIRSCSATHNVNTRDHPRRIPIRNASSANIHHPSTTPYTRRKETKHSRIIINLHLRKPPHNLRTKPPTNIPTTIPTSSTHTLILLNPRHHHLHHLRQSRCGRKGSHRRCCPAG